MAAENALIVIEPENPAELFVPDVIDMLLSKGKALKDQHVAEDVTTEAGRKATKAFARQFVTAKTTVDGIGKTYVAELKALPREVDALRKKVRDTMDEYRDEVLQPVQEWEDAENEKVRLQCLAAKKDADEIDAYDEESLRERERKVAAQEAELFRQAEEKLKAEQEEATAKEQKERDERIGREAAEKAEKDAAEVVRVAEENAAKAKQDLIDAEAKAKADQEAAVKAAELRVTQEAEQKEAERLAAEHAAKEKAEKKAANKRHQLAIQREAVVSLMDAGLKEPEAAHMIEMIDAGTVRHVTINY